MRSGDLLLFCIGDVVVLTFKHIFLFLLRSSFFSTTTTTTSTTLPRSQIRNLDSNLLHHICTMA
jgi:hypothetical protein